MPSEELKEILNKTRRTKDISLSVEQVEEIIKDLEIVEIIRKKITYHINPFGNGYIGYVITDDVEEFDLIKEWLNGKD